MFKGGYEVINGFYVYAFQKHVFGVKRTMYAVESHDTVVFVSGNLDKVREFCGDFRATCNQIQKK